MMGSRSKGGYKLEENRDLEGRGRKVRKLRSPCVQVVKRSRRFRKSGRQSA